MKTLFILPVFLLTLLGCSKDSKKEEPTPAYVGKWQLIETYISDGGEPDYTKIENGYILSLKKDNTYSTTEYSECNSGRFSFAEDVITYQDQCGNLNSQNNRFRIISNDTEKLIVNNVVCIEPCSYVFKRVE